MHIATVTMLVVAPCDAPETMVVVVGVATFWTVGVEMDAKSPPRVFLVFVMEVVRVLASILLAADSALAAAAAVVVAVKVTTAARRAATADESTEQPVVHVLVLAV